MWGDLNIWNELGAFPSLKGHRASCMLKALNPRVIKAAAEAFNTLLWTRQKRVWVHSKAAKTSLNSILITNPDRGLHSHARGLVSTMASFIYSAVDRSRAHHLHGQKMQNSDSVRKKYDYTTTMGKQGGNQHKINLSNLQVFTLRIRKAGEREREMVHRAQCCPGPEFMFPAPP